MRASHIQYDNKDPYRFLKLSEHNIEAPQRISVVYYSENREIDRKEIRLNSDKKNVFTAQQEWSAQAFDVLELIIEPVKGKSYGMDQINFN